MRSGYALDKVTNLWVQVGVQGEQNAKDKFGSANVYIRGIVNSNFPAPTPIHRAANWVYLYTFYANKRRDYIERYKRVFLEFEEEIKNLFGLLEKTRD